MTCNICAKRHMSGNKVSHSNHKTRRRQCANVQRLRARIGSSVGRVYACTRCIRSGKVVKAL